MDNFYHRSFVLTELDLRAVNLKHRFEMEQVLHVGKLLNADTDMNVSSANIKGVIYSGISF